MPQPKKGILDTIAKKAAKGAAKKAAKKADKVYVQTERKKAGATLKELGKGLKDKAKAEKAYIKSERKKASATLKAAGKEKPLYKVRLKPAEESMPTSNVKVIGKSRATTKQIADAGLMSRTAPAPRRPVKGKRGTAKTWGRRDELN